MTNRQNDKMTNRQNDKQTSISLKPLFYFKARFHYFCLCVNLTNMTNKQIDKQTNRQNDKQAIGRHNRPQETDKNKMTNRGNRQSRNIWIETDRVQADARKQTNPQTDKCTNRQINKCTNR